MSNKTIQKILHEHYCDEGSHTPESQICETCVAELNQLITQAMLDVLPEKLVEDEDTELLGDIFSIGYQRGYNQAIDQMETAIKKMGEKTHD